MKTGSKDVHGLFKSFYKLLFISLGASVFLSYFIFFIPLNASFIREQENYFRNEVMIKASSDDHLILDFMSSADSLGSRTVIRQKLIDYHRGAVGLAELREFVQPKYADGASAVRNLIGASRHLPDGTMIASWGDGSLYARHAEATPGFHLYAEDGGLFALAISRIEEKGTYLGYDACVFKANILVDNKSEIVRSYEIRAAGSIDGAGRKHLYSVPLHEERYLLLALPDNAIFKDATLKAFYFVTLYSCTLFVFISIFSYLTFYRFVRKIIDDHVRLIAKADGLLAERELILKEVHHRIKNNMNTIGSLLSLQASALPEPAAVAALTDAGNRIRSMSLLYDRLYRSTDYAELSVKDYLSTLADEIVSNFPNSGIVKLEKRLQDFNLDARRLQPLGIIVNELITNTMKHAFRGRASGVITMTATRSDGRVVVSIQDDGVGIANAPAHGGHGGFGLQLVNALAAQLDGTIRTEADHGTRIVLDFPA